MKIHDSRNQRPERRREPIYVELMVRLTPRLYRLVKHRADSDRLTVNEWIVRLVKRNLP